MSSWLHIGEKQTTVRLNDDVGGTDEVLLAIGATGLCRRYFHHEPPTAGELEAAIEAVEDVLMPAIPRLRGPGPLVTDDAESLALVEAAALPPGAATELDLAAVERLFNRLADVASGRPVASEGLPVRGSFAANLLILRELMHHAGRTSVTVVSPIDEGEHS